jgi:Collagen triple helix repeat (20 copies)
MRSEPYERRTIMNMPSLVKPVSVLLLAGAMLLPALSAADATLIADTYISAGAPATNFGSATSMSIAAGNAGLVQFDLSSIPASSTVPVAYLKVYVNKVNATGTLTFSQVLTGWNEAVVTAPGPVAAPSFASAPVTVANSFVLVDVTTQVNGWLASPGSNFGIEIAGTGLTDVLLDTKENTATSHAATLEVTIVGPQGSSGSPGATGATGANGPAGATGATGPKGATGASGPSGAAGATGAIGPSGPSGPSGAIGFTGIRGALGLQGQPGATGPTGSSGAAGATGPVGATGPRGATGVQGDTGGSGSPGPEGATGPIGNRGFDGPTSNQFAFDTTVRSSGYTIPDTDTFMYYLVNNNGSTPGILVLPHATVKGRVLIAINANLSATSGPAAVQVNRQGTDLIYGSSGTTGVTFIASQRAIFLYTDGTGKWYLYN